MDNKYYLSIGEPWNFEGPDSPNKIVGSIVSVLSGDYLIFKFDKVVSFPEKNVQGDTFLLSARHVGYPFQEADNYQVSFNASLILGGGYEGIFFEEFRKNLISSLIGSIRVLENQ